MNIVGRCLLSSLFVVFSMGAMAAADDDNGTVEISGSIVNGACSIESGNRYQTIDIGGQSIDQLLVPGSDAHASLKLRLENCSVAGSTVAISFEGEEDGEHFAIRGEARGISLLVSSRDDVPILPGQPVEFYQLDGDELNFKVRMVANNQSVKAGDYRAALRFKVEHY